MFDKCKICSLKKADHLMASKAMCKMCKRAKQKEKRVANPAANRVSVINTKDKKLGYIPSWTIEKDNLFWLKWGKKCFNCNSDDRLCITRYRNKARDLDNAIPLCQSCLAELTSLSAVLYFSPGQFHTIHRRLCWFRYNKINAEGEIVK